ncbi:MAG: Holliday junction branch migration protein RuvA [Candidatus Margulisiibacteriota bacterium]
MLSHICGTLEASENNLITVDVNGVGYDIMIPLSMAASLPKKGEKIRIDTFFAVREDAVALFGFPDKETKSLFKHLISVSGIGPKAAMSLLSSFETRLLIASITKGDVALLSSASGVGKKTAERLIVELKEKLAKAYKSESGQTPLSISTEEPLLKDIVSALMALGYGAKEARTAAMSCGIDFSQKPSIEEAIKKALKAIS